MTTSMPARAASARSSDRLQLFAATAPGLEPLAAAELRAIGIANPKAEPGGVTFAGRAEHLYRANLWLRTASRVVARLGEFHASAFHELERQARRLPWERFVAPGQPVVFRVTCRKSRLYHSDAVAERLAGALAHRLGGAVPVQLLQGEEGADDVTDEAAGEVPGGQPEGGALPPQLFTARLLHDQCTVSVDTSGALLHRRGYREAVAKAPLRETLAAAILLGAGWDGTTPLLDPMCGSGTIAIEGAMIARRLAPGAHRRFAFMAWPDYDEARWSELLERAAADALPASPVPIHASDRDAGATAAAAANAERAGVGADLTISTRALSQAEPPAGAGPGLVAVNPPYGVRVGDPDRLRNLYAQLGKLLHSRFPAWRVALLSADRALEAQVGVALEEALRTTNGGIPVRLAVGEVG
jgi:putative N6-adenine-specific DNA methylase